MKKIETIWHHILYNSLEKKQYKYTQQGLAKEFGYSLSTVHHALKIPASLGAIRKTSKFFVLENFEKLLFYWASVRNLAKDIIYSTFLELPMIQLEGFVPADSIYAGYSAAKKILGEAPADYSKIYFYYPQNKLDYLQKRLPPASKQANVFVLKLHPAMLQYGSVTTLPQTFVDIWNLRDWYANDFTQSLEKKIHGLLS
ncbi:MAG: hypothetical protein ABIJ23_02490 [Candidatus Magasanikbacteria bacterium]